MLLTSCNGKVALVALSIQPGISTLAVGDTLEYHVTAGYADGTIVDVTSKITLASSDASIAEFIDRARIKAIKPGSVTIRVSLEDLSATARLIVPALLIWDEGDWEFDWG